ncbi:MAG: LuxR C-terminal-related transcriptional regulator [Oscillospiraceae bacterium]|nr:LuxR C-terminal-related transcriptional regulator [Oscillospiraceae bacterium]
MERYNKIPTAPRNELMKILDNASSKRITYIHAPAGYGKSFSIRIWLEHSRIHNAWESINALTGRKPAEFCGRFLAALSTLQPQNAPLKDIITHKSFGKAPFEFAEKALSYFRDFSQAIPHKKYALVIDDLHLITKPSILKQLCRLFWGLPESVKLFILSRSEPPECLSEFIVKDMMSIIDAEYLNFSAEEIKSFFASCDQILTEKQTDDIMSATKGWAIGLNAILLSGYRLRGRKFHSRYLEAFIREQIWENWDLGRKNFMLCVSVEEELSPEFCDYMTGRTDSEEILDDLVRENAFISTDNDNVYYFHHLFQEFLRNMLEKEDERTKSDLYKKAGDWFFEREDYYGAVRHYMNCNNKNGITKALKLMYDYNSPYAAIEDTVWIIHMSVNESIVTEYPFLLEVQAWAAFVEGRGADMEGYIDRYFKQLPKIIIQNPASAQTSLLISCMDYRNSTIDMTKRLKNIPLKWFSKAKGPSFSQNLPFFHKSGRDFSEYANNTEENLSMLKKTIGFVIGEAFEVMSALIKAGIAYEQGELNNAHRLAVYTNANLKESHAPELQFCSYMLLAAILDAQEYGDDAQDILDRASEMIERNKAYYLNDNFRAFVCRIKMADGDTNAALDWIRHFADETRNSLSFYKIYQHFTTARAYIVTGDFNAAILLLKKLQALCEQYRRTIDIIEVNILLAIAYWNRPRGNSNDAFAPLEDAIIKARQYRYTQIFTNDGADLCNMLHKLQKRVVQKGYTGDIGLAEVKNLYVTAVARSKYSCGLTGSRETDGLIFTDRQKTVMFYLNKGLTHKEIGDQMGLKFSSIKSHLILIYKKLNVSNNVDAIVKIRELGLLDGEGV